MRKLGLLLVVAAMVVFAGCKDNTETTKQKDTKTKSPTSQPVEKAPGKGPLGTITSPGLPEIKPPTMPAIPKIDLPKTDLPKIDLPKVDLPKTDVPKVPGITTPKIDPTTRPALPGIPKIPTPGLPK